MQTHSLIVMAPLRVISSPLFDRIVTHYCIITALAPATVFILFCNPFLLLKVVSHAQRCHGDKGPVYPPTLRQDLLGRDHVFSILFIYINKTNA